MSHERALLLGLGFVLGLLCWAGWGFERPTSRRELQLQQGLEPSQTHAALVLGSAAHPRKERHAPARRATTDLGDAYLNSARATAQPRSELVVWLLDEKAHGCAQVEVELARRPLGSGSLRQRSDELGRLTWSGLTPGAYLLTAQLGTRRILEVQLAGGRREVSWNLTPPSTAVTGRLCGAQGEGLAGHRVALCATLEDGSSRRVAVAATEANGEFSFADVPEGPYLLEASPTVVRLHALGRDEPWHGIPLENRFLHSDPDLGAIPLPPFRGYVLEGKLRLESDASPPALHLFDARAQRGVRLRVDERGHFTWVSPRPPASIVLAYSGKDGQTLERQLSPRAGTRETVELRP